jgi:hypothetical protein
MGKILPGKIMAPWNNAAFLQGMGRKLMHLARQQFN